VGEHFERFVGTRRVKRSVFENVKYVIQDSRNGGLNFDT
jgi:hypothetical protein